MRAYYYFELLRLYGPIPLISEDPIPLDASLEELIKERNSVDECVNFIATELQSAIDSGDLLQRAGKANLGRMDVATCMHSRQSCTSIGQVRFSTEIRIRRQSRIKTANNFSLRAEITPNGLRHAMHMNGL